MPATQVTPDAAPEDLRKFIASIPSPDAIRERIEQNAHEASLLKRILKLAVDADKARGGKGDK